mmetsp:Transcript_20020/g.50676  ORF Transcript_20020/g.50676 Transcript_20020/m.50676 type:complete len:301 (+) Transcript_20020:125-1027(+)
MKSWSLVWSAIRSSRIRLRSACTVSTSILSITSRRTSSTSARRTASALSAMSRSNSVCCSCAATRRRSSSPRRIPLSLSAMSFASRSCCASLALRSRRSAASWRTCASSVCTFATATRSFAVSARAPSSSFRTRASSARVSSRAARSRPSWSSRPAERSRARASSGNSLPRTTPSCMARSRTWCRSGPKVSGAATKSRSWAPAPSAPSSRSDWLAKLSAARRLLSLVLAQTWRSRSARALLSRSTKPALAAVSITPGSSKVATARRRATSWFFKSCSHVAHSRSCISSEYICSACEDISR